MGPGMLLSWNEVNLLQTAGVNVELEATCMQWDLSMGSKCVAEDTLHAALLGVCKTPTRGNSSQHS